MIILVFLVIRVLVAIHQQLVDLNVPRLQQVCLWRLVATNNGGGRLAIGTAEGLL